MLPNLQSTGSNRRADGSNLRGLCAMALQAELPRGIVRNSGMPGVARGGGCALRELPKER